MPGPCSTHVGKQKLRPRALQQQPDMRHNSHTSWLSIRLGLHRASLLTALQLKPAAARMPSLTNWLVAGGSYYRQQERDGALSLLYCPAIAVALNLRDWLHVTPACCLLFSQLKLHM